MGESATKKGVWTGIRACALPIFELARWNTTEGFWAWNVLLASNSRGPLSLVVGKDIYGAEKR